MITVTDECAAVLDGRTFVMSARATVTRAGTVLAADLPITSGSEEFDDGLRVPERVTITVPSVLDGVSMVPTSPSSPLAPYGQRLHVKVGIGLGSRIEWLDRGEFLIHTVRRQGKDLIVTAVGLLALIEEARLVQAWKPSGTFTTSLRSLVEPALTVTVHSSVAALDRSVPATLNQDEDRLQAVLDLLAAWPARAQVAPGGYLQVLPVEYHPTGGIIQQFNTPESPYANVVDVGGALTRDGLYNTAVARGQASDGQQVIGAAYDRTAGSATALGSPFNPLPVPTYFYSPLLTTATQCQEAAASILRRKAAITGPALELDCVPDPRMVGNDLATYRPERLLERETDVVLERLVLPYTSDDGPMKLVVREPAP